MSDDQDHPRPAGGAGTEADLTVDVQVLPADVLARLDAIAAKLDRLGVEHGTVVEQLQDNLADVASGEVVGALWDEVRAMRAELDTGLVVEPSDALSASLDALRADVDSLRDALGELSAPAAPAADGGAGVEALADQVAALRDFVASELETVRQTVAARIDAAAEATAASVAARPEPEPSVAAASALDADTVAVLRDEIRAAGAIPDQVIDALREELKALRRRIAVKASERVLDDQQLAQIADAVAARLAADREQA